MADHATTGGYAIAGTVITADLPVAAQLAPGDWIEFQACAMKEADRALAELEASIGPV
jgi:antagonist of KipI